jgi:hypothetical protein
MREPPQRTGKGMAHYHLMHCVPPDPRVHGLHGYKEVIDSVAWGLEQFNHRVTYALNQPRREATNIVFGAQVLPIATLKRLPEGTIIYNFEQMPETTAAAQFRPEVRYYAQASHFEIWEYSAANVPGWRALGRHQVKIVPVGYAPLLTRIPKAAVQDIDVLIYGMSGERRLQTFHALSQRGLSTIFVSGLYGAARDEFISRTKIVLNINNLYPQTKVFEVVRVSYLLANKKAVVADLAADISIEDDIRSAVKFASSLPELLSLCDTLVHNDRERTKLEELGFSTIIRRDVRNILKSALADG